jgi:CelD/BcsL family acetyltransferase involved in cellulose biosynthesis
VWRSFLSQFAGWDREVILFVECIDQPSQLEAIVPLWQTLSVDRFFQSPDWLLPWWDVYATAADRLQLLLVWSDSSRRTLLGLAPWYLHIHRLTGVNRWRFLGDRTVCTDHQRLLYRDGAAACVGESLGRWCAARLQQPTEDLIVGADWQACDGEDAAWQAFFAALSAAAGGASRAQQTECWRVDLQAGWSAHLASVAKSTRRRLKMLDHMRASRRVEWVESQSQLEPFLADLAGLHRKRWQAAGESGCFDDPFIAFTTQVCSRALASGRLRAGRLMHEGVSIAAVLGFVSGDSWYVYQSGVDPDHFATRPGQLLMLASLRAALAEGCRYWDLLRGDESYKRQVFGARPCANHRFTCVGQGWWPRLQASVTGAGDWLRRSGGRWLSEV